MNKKEYIIQILKELEDVWEYADSFLRIIKIVDDDKIITLFFNFLKGSLEKFSNEKAIYILEKNRGKLKEYLKEEKKENINDTNELLELEKQLEVLF